ncbi:MAG: hypothetical protein AAF366_17800 [Pseudomonadota bacterium]
MPADPHLEVDAPVVTFPEREASFLRAHYKQADCILEYGSGGSTLIACDLNVRHVMTVESDVAWMEDVRAAVKARNTATQVDLFHGNVGPTGKWGWPDSNEAWQQFHTYPTAIWDQDFFEHPDVVLIDGRFRPACFVTTMIRITRPVTVLFDDYIGRGTYQTVEEFAEPMQVVGRIARFELEPRPFPAEKLSALQRLFTIVR